MRRTKLNYWVDVCIGATLLVSAVSGLVFLVPTQGAAVLGVSFRTWDTIHTWSSLAMIGGAALHLLLHWKWLVTMTKRMVAPPARGGQGASGQALTRRRFLRLGLGAAALATLAAAYRTAAGTDADEAATPGAAVPVSASDPSGGEGQAPSGEAPASEPSRTAETVAEESAPDDVPTVGPTEPSPTSVPPTETPEPEPETELGVACPFGLVNDPYPGRCRRYVDRNQDGICDHSVLGSGTVRTRS